MTPLIQKTPSQSTTFTKSTSWAVTIILHYPFRQCSDGTKVKKINARRYWGNPVVWRKTAQCRVDMSQAELPPASC